jgi:hypothetical protein
MFHPNIPKADISPTSTYPNNSHQSHPNINPKSSPRYPKNVPKPVPPKYVLKQISVLPQLIPTAVISPNLTYLKNSPHPMLEMSQKQSHISMSHADLIILVPPHLVPTTVISPTLIYLKSSPRYPKNVPKPIPPKYVPKQISVLPQLIPTTVISPTLTYLKNSPHPTLEMSQKQSYKSMSHADLIISVTPQLFPTIVISPTII